MHRLQSSHLPLDIFFVPDQRIWANDIEAVVNLITDSFQKTDRPFSETTKFGHPRLDVGGMGFNRGTMISPDPNDPGWGRKYLQGAKTQFVRDCEWLN